jgi:hypothetical protein
MPFIGESTDRLRPERNTEIMEAIIGSLYFRQQGWLACINHRLTRLFRQSIATWTNFTEMNCRPSAIDAANGGPRYYHGI